MNSTNDETFELRRRRLLQELVVLDQIQARTAHSSSQYNQDRDPRRLPFSSMPAMSSTIYPPLFGSHHSRNSSAPSPGIQTPTSVRSYVRLESSPPWGDHPAVLEQYGPTLNLSKSPPDFSILLNNPSKLLWPKDQEGPLSL